MKYSMEAQVPLEKFCSQIPHQWLKSVSEARSPVSDELIVSDEPVANIEVDRQRAQLMDQIRYLKSSFSAESGKLAVSSFFGKDIRKISINFSYVFVFYYIERCMGKVRYFKHIIPAPAIFSGCRNTLPIQT
jgi:hypothetical protein